MDKNITSKSSWALPPPIEQDQYSDIDLPNVLKALLHRRGLQGQKDIEEFYQASNIPDVWKHFPDLDIAIDRLIIAFRKEEKIAICGDYDADGMTSTALLINSFREMQCNAVAAIPDRIKDGYGLNKIMVRKLSEAGISLLITVDNGINAYDAIDLANELNIDVIITDHHEIKGNPPSSLALLHPKTTPNLSPYRNLAGVGLAYILASGLANKINKLPSLQIALDLFCIGTIADMAPLTGFNRYLLKKGLKKLHLTKCEGLRALIKLSGINDSKITAQDISFKIAPRINAIGRIGDPNTILNLFSETNHDKAIEIARECDHTNRVRRDLSSGIESEAIAILEADSYELSPFILIAQSHWHPGIVGIVASRLVERFNRPTALLAGNNDGLFRASVRAPAGFSVNKVLESCSKNLVSYGGHPAAGGFTIKAEHITKLHEQLNKYAELWINENDNKLLIRPEAYINLSAINMKLWFEISELEPFGISNQKPLFWSRKCKIIQKNYLKGGHIKYTINQGNKTIDGIQWRARLKEHLPDLVDIVFQISLNQWQGEKQLILEIKDIKPYQDIVNIKRNGRIYKCFQPNDDEIVIQNNNNDKIIFCKNPPYENVSDLRNIKGSYIKSLKEEVILALGLSH